MTERQWPLPTDRDEISPEVDAEGRSGQVQLVWAPTLAATALLGAYQLAPLPLALASAAACLVLACRWPLAVVAATVLVLPYYEVARPVIWSWGFPAAEIGALVCILAAILRLLSPCLPEAARRRLGVEPTLGLGARLRRWLRSGLTFPECAALALVALGVLSLAVSIREWESLRSLRVVVVEPVALYFVVVGSATRRDVERLAIVIVGSAVLVSLLGIYHYATNQNIITAEESLRRIRALYGSPNHLGLYLGRAFPLAAGLALLAPARRWAYALALLPIGVALLLTFSIGAWVGVLAALLVVVALHSRRLFGWSLGVLAAVALVAAPVALNVERISSHFDLTGGTNFARFQVWESALNMVRDHPLFGVGLDNFLYYYRDLGYMLASGWREPNLSHPHNLFLDFWLSLGLAGLLLALALLVHFFHRGVGLYRSERTPLARALALGAMASMVDFAIHGQFDNSYFLPDLAVIFWLTFAIVRVLQATTSVDSSPSGLPRDRAGGMATG